MDNIMHRAGIITGHGQLQRVTPQKKTLPEAGASKEFGQILEELKFSKHAANRINTRAIDLSHADLERLNKGVSLARQKGVRDALIMMDNKVFIANIKNNTVITATTEEQLKENVFTNIDGAVIV